MLLTRAHATERLAAFLRQLFSLPEVEEAQVKDVRITRRDSPAAAAAAALDACWHDSYSDVDMTLRLCLHPEDAKAGYGAQLNRLGISGESCLGFFIHGDSSVCRVVFRDGMRYDLSFVCRGDETTPRLPAPPAPKPASPVWDEERVYRFWFVQVQALGKLYRDDYLISRHLSHMNLNETLEQQMVLRDLEHGTNHHRYGYREAAVYQKYAGSCPFLSGETDFDQIANGLWCAAHAYDELTARLLPGSEARAPVFASLWQAYAAARHSN